MKLPGDLDRDRVILTGTLAEVVSMARAKNLIIDRLVMSDGDYASLKQKVAAGTHGGPWPSLAIETNRYVRSGEVVADCRLWPRLWHLAEVEAAMDELLARSQPKVEA